MAEGKKRAPNARGYALIIFFAALGVGLMVLAGAITPEKQQGDGNAQQAIVTYDEREYEEQLIAKIRALCASVKGAGQTSVAIRLDGTYKAVYAVDEQSGDAKRSQHVLVGSGSEENALLVGYSPPDILGIGIVCEGGGDMRVRSEIISLLSAAFDLPTNKIYVTAS